ncbi:MAG TPA: class I SAM-dependent methyltransferase [Oscillatoriales cyanobacterium M59_W2019_021]|nr:class I SAM-dependent methyltransferase [Oscillatoriales cyanobacterium M4454_W2019_049]HIK53372.1 class I SAM-dependent methyltransferase [Oscillatoriales cyanobacterium M59_W2019_021]
MNKRKSSKIYRNNINLDATISDLMQFAKTDQSLHQFQTQISAHQYRKIYHLFLQYLNPNMKVLDWGTGNGHFSYFLVKAGCQTSGYGFEDLPPICQSLSPDQYTYYQGNWSDPTKLPFTDEFFDAVSSIGVLEHVRETGGTEVDSLNEIRRILKPNGLFLCVHFPNRYSWIEYAARKMKKWSHEYCYTEREIYELARLTHFQVLNLQRYAFLPRNIWRKLPRKLVNSGIFTNLYDSVDLFLSIAFSHWCQNYLFIAQKSVL